MKTTILLAAAITVSGGIWLRAQQSEPENLGKASAAEAAQSTRCEAKLLTVEQQEKLKALAKPESIMQCMRAMKHPEATDEQIGHDLSLGCSEIDDKGEDAHSSH